MQCGTKSTPLHPNNERDGWCNECSPDVTIKAKLPTIVFNQEANILGEICFLRSIIKRDKQSERLLETHTIALLQREELVSSL
jgi:hypothetical protein